MVITYLKFNIFLYQLNIVGSDGCVVRLVKMHANWFRHSRVSRIYICAGTCVTKLFWFKSAYKALLKEVLILKEFINIPYNNWFISILL